MPGRKHGKNGRIMMDPTGGTAVVTVADLNAWTLDMSKDRVEVTAFEDTNKIRVQGLPEFSGTFGGWWNSATSPALFAAILGDIPVFLNLIPDKTEPTYFFRGLANLDGSINVSSGGGISISGKWDAAGNWTMAP
jgi:hypothetical protein